MIWAIRFFSNSTPCPLDNVHPLLPVFFSWWLRLQWWSVVRRKSCGRRGAICGQSYFSPLDVWTPLGGAVCGQFSLFLLTVHTSSIAATLKKRRRGEVDICRFCLCPHPPNPSPSYPHTAQHCTDEEQRTKPQFFLMYQNSESTVVQWSSPFPF